jgi:hypothetical protein
MRKVEEILDETLHESLCDAEGPSHLQDGDGGVCDCDRPLRAIASAQREAWNEAVEVAARLADGGAETARAASLTQQGWLKARDLARDIRDVIRSLYREEE